MAEFHQGGGFQPALGLSLEKFCNMPSLPGRRLGSLNPKVKPAMQLLFALEGSM